MISVDAETVIVAANELERAEKMRSVIVEVSLLKREFDLKKEEYDEKVDNAISTASKQLVKRFTDKEWKGLKKAGEALAKDKIADLHRDTEILSQVIRSYLTA